MEEYKDKEGEIIIMKTKHVMQINDKIYVAGHNGLVGSAIIRKLRKKGFENIITRSHSELDLTNPVSYTHLTLPTN